MTSKLLLSGALMATVLLFSGSALAADGDKPAPAAAPAAAATGDLAAATELFKLRCASCHGDKGLGDGPAAAALTPKPRNYTDKAWQAATTDDQIKKIILGGGLSVGKSPLMPAAPDLQAKPEVVQGLVTLIRNYGK